MGSCHAPAPPAPPAPLPPATWCLLPLPDGGVRRPRTCGNVRVADFVAEREGGDLCLHRRVPWRDAAPRRAAQLAALLRGRSFRRVSIGDNLWQADELPALCRLVEGASAEEWLFAEDRRLGEGAGALLAAAARGAGAARVREVSWWGSDAEFGGLRALAPDLAARLTALQALTLTPARNRVESVCHIDSSLERCNPWYGGRMESDVIVSLWWSVNKDGVRCRSEAAGAVAAELAGALPALRQLWLGSDEEEEEWEPGAARAVAALCAQRPGVAVFGGIASAVRALRRAAPAPGAGGCGKGEVAAAGSGVADCVVCLEPLLLDGAPCLLTHADGRPACAHGAQMHVACAARVLDASCAAARPPRRRAAAGDPDFDPEWAHLASPPSAATAAAAPAARCPLCREPFAAARAR